MYSKKSFLFSTTDVITAKLENAKKENEFVFHEKVPEISSLEEPKGASLVKGIGFDPADPDGPCGPDIFAKLVPYSAHEAASLYSEEKAKLLRCIGKRWRRMVVIACFAMFFTVALVLYTFHAGEEIDTKDRELAEFLSTLDLEEIPRPDADLALPQEVIECAASFSVKGGGGTSEDGGSGGGEAAVNKLSDAMDRIATISDEVEGALTEIKKMLEVRGGLVVNCK